MRKLILGLLFCFGLGAQTITLTQPDCVIFFGFTATGQTQPLSPFAGYDNRQVGCTTWNLSYSISGFSSITIELEGAPNNAGSPGSWAAFPNQNLLVGSNPNTITANGSFVWLYGYNPWVRVKLTASTGSGIVNGAAFGYRIPSASTSSGAPANVNVADWGGVATSLGQKAMASSVPVAIASDQSVLANNVTQFGGNNVATGTGASGVGIPRVTVSNDSSLAANQSTNVNQFGGSAVVTGTGSGGAGIPRVTISNDSTLAANQSVNVAQIAGASTATAASGVQKVGIVGNAGAIVDGATGAAPPANVIFMGGLASGATGGHLLGVTVCDLDYVVNIASGTTTLAVTGVSGRQVRICSLDLVASAADNVALIEGTGGTCGSGTAGMNGGTSAASGWNFAANGGLTQGNGLGEVLTTASTGDSVCIVTSSSAQLSGHIKYTIY